MKQPPFKITGQSGRLRYRDAEDRLQGKTGRRSFLWVVYLQGRIAGTIQTDAEMAIRREGPWHRISVTAAEAQEALSGHFTTRGKVSQALQCRRARQARGLPLAK